MVSKTRVTRPGRREARAAFLASLPTWEAVTALLDEVNLAWGRVRPWREALQTNPSVGPRNILAEIDDRVGGTRQTTQAPYQFSDAKAQVRGPAPYRGEHNEDVLREWLGRSPDAVRALRDAGC